MTVDIYTTTAGDSLSQVELDLYHLIMDYRAENGLASIALSESLTVTAGRHAIDTTANIWDESIELPDGANLHSWSDDYYYSDHSSPETMWYAPSRLGTAYTSPGFEISAAGYASVEAALEGWKGSSGHDDVILNNSIWTDMEWTSIGIGVEIGSGENDNYGGLVYHVWFGADVDPAGAPVIYAGSADDEVIGTDFVDEIYGEAGDDTIDGGTGADLLVGGDGSDWIIVDDAEDRVVESRNWEGTDTVESSVDFRMGSQHIEDLILTGDAEIGAGNGLENVITGNDGDNILDGGKNNDTLIGGEGNDTYLLRAPSDTIVEAEGEGIDVAKSYGSFALMDNVEKLFMQTVYSSDGTAVNFNGIGNGLDNTIVGTPFDNTIIGRGGSDTLKGQAGADTFVFDRAIGTNNVDRIIDFNTNEVNEGDILKLKGSLFGDLEAGDLDASHFTSGTSASLASTRFVFDQGAGELYYDVDGTGVSDQILIATFEQDAVVTVSDFEIF
jgi:Ca2+-binding RTX toxin-like protein